MKKNGGTTLPGGRVSRQSQRVGGLMQPFQFLENRKFAVLKNICILWCWNLQNMLELPFHFCISKKKKRWNSDIQNFYSEILNFRLFYAKKSQFSSIFRSGMSLWRHNYVTPWSIVLILVCMDREGPYLPINTKINFIGGSVWKI